MKERRISFGPGAASLILVIVTLCLSLLGLLSLSSAKNDYALSKAAARVSEEVYAGMAGAEKQLATLDTILLGCAQEAKSDEEYLSLVAASLPEGMEMVGRVVFLTQTQGNRSLYGAVALSEPGVFPRMVWQEHKTIVEDEIWN